MPAARLFAFGYDAWLLTAYLEKLATGELDYEGFVELVATSAPSTGCRTPSACCSRRACATATGGS